MSALCLVPIALLLAPVQGDPVRSLAAWVSRARSSPAGVDEKRTVELREILGELRLVRAGAEDDVHALDQELVELATLEWRANAGTPGLLACARLGRAELAYELRRPNAALAAHLGFEVLASAAKAPRDQRLLAAQLLEGVRVPALLPILRSVAREEDPELARAAVDALCGWNAAGAHLFFLEELERPRGRTAAAAEHFVRTRAALELPVLERLEHEVARRYVADDWREAARARALARALDPPRSVPIWIEALAAWERRGTEGKGSRRIQGEILADLQQLSGRSIGPDPHLWSTWWEAVRSGRIALPADRAAAGEQSSSAAFFGLHVATDRVLFVVDRSGSMRAAFGTGRRSRHEEAIDQLESFLRRSGEETQFSIAVFNGKGDAWRSHLVPASPANLADARGWLAGRSPQGATNLFAGLAAGLDLDAHGRLELERCEADTVIVLCDGATEEGPSWVRGWLGEQNESAQLVFHCVQIGSGGDGTLEALAAGTGGKFLRIEG